MIPTPSLHTPILEEAVSCCRRSLRAKIRQVSQSGDGQEVRLAAAVAARHRRTIVSTSARTAMTHRPLPALTLESRLLRDYPYSGMPKSIGDVQVRNQGHDRGRAHAIRPVLAGRGPRVVRKSFVGQRRPPCEGEDFSSTC